MLDYISPFTYLFRDKGWLKKFLIASLLTYTLVGAEPVGGWMVEIVRRVRAGESAALPEWEKWWAYWRPGGLFLAVTLLWLLPLALAITLLVPPLLLRGHLADWAVVGIWGSVAFCVLIFLLAYSVLYAFFVPAMLVRLAEGRGVWQSASPAALWRTVRPYFMDYLLVCLIVGMGLVNVALFLSALTLFLLLPPLVVYVGLVTAHFAGQLGKKIHHE